VIEGADDGGNAMGLEFANRAMASARFMPGSYTVVAVLALAGPIVFCFRLVLRANACLAKSSCRD
jgi:hypothetical protein